MDVERLIESSNREEIMNILGQCVLALDVDDVADALFNHLDTERGEDLAFMLGERYYGELPEEDQKGDDK